MRRTDKGHPHRDDPPRDHDAREPTPCTPTLHDNGAGNFQNDVAEGKDARPEPDYAIVEAEIVGHLQRRSGKIVAIKVSNYIKQEHIRQKPQRNPTASAASNGNVIGNNGWAHNFLSAKIGLVGQSTLPENITRLYTGPSAGGAREKNNCCKQAWVL